MATSGRLLDKAFRAEGGKKEFDRKFHQYQKNLSLIDEKHEQLLKKYDGNWIAVYNSKVIAHAGTLQELMEKINSTGLPVPEILIEFISSRRVLTLYYT